MTPEILAEVLINGIVIGSIYALFAMGLALIFGVLEFVNFAHGEFYMLGAMLTATLTQVVGLDYWLTVPIVVLISIAAGVALYDGLWCRLKQGDYEKSILITIGLALVLQNGALYVWGPTPRLITTSFVTDIVQIGELTIPTVRLIALAVSLGALLIVFLVLNHTRAGLALRGVAQSREAALMVGIQVRKVSRFAVGAGIGLCGLSGAVLALIYTIFPTMGVLLAFKAFAIVIIGGLGSVVGAAVVGFSLGVLESFFALYLSAGTTNVAIFMTMILVLLFWPLGLFGRRIRL